MFHWAQEPDAFFLLKKSSKTTLGIIENSETLRILKGIVGFQGFAERKKGVGELLGVDAVVTEDSVGLAKFFFDY